MDVGKQRHPTGFGPYLPPLEPSKKGPKPARDDNNLLLWLGIGAGIFLLIAGILLAVWLIQRRRKAQMRAFL